MRTSLFMQLSLVFAWHLIISITPRLEVRCKLIPWSDQTSGFEGDTSIMKDPGRLHTGSQREIFNKQRQLLLLNPCYKIKSSPLSEKFRPVSSFITLNKIISFYSHFSGVEVKDLSLLLKGLPALLWGRAGHDSVLPGKKHCSFYVK